jgi:hypothetical protein
MAKDLKCRFLLSVTILLSVAGCGNVTSSAPVETKKTVADPTPTPPIQPKTPCPVKLDDTRMIHNAEMDVYTTVTNISDTDITAIAFDANHTNSFGTTLEPYKTNLTSEEKLLKGHSRSMHWEILMEEPTTFQRKPGTSEMYVAKVAFADGRIVSGTEFEGCDFIH